MSSVLDMKGYFDSDQDSLDRRNLINTITYDGYRMYSILVSFFFFLGSFFLVFIVPCFFARHPIFKEHYVFADIRAGLKETNCKIYSYYMLFF